MDSGWMSEGNLGIGRFHFIGEGFLLKLRRTCCSLEGCSEHHAVSLKGVCWNIGLMVASSVTWCKDVSDVSGLRGCRGIIFVYILCCIYIATHALARAWPSVNLLVCTRSLFTQRSNLLSSHFFMYMDHRTLQNFDNQRDLSRRQARWQEYMLQFELTLVYIKGEEDNCVADGLSRRPPDETVRLDTTPRHVTLNRSKSVTTIVSLEADQSLLKEIKEGYKNDEWCKKLISAEKLPNVHISDGLWYMGNCLIIPKVGSIREDLFRVVHDSLGHFGMDKLYAALREGYYWLGMRRDLEQGYIPSCMECQQNKNSTSKARSPLHTHSGQSK
jgi:hypothetical protein